MPKPRNVGIFDLLQYRFPIMAIVSIFHRITGVLLLLYLPVVLYYLRLSLKDPACFEGVKATLTHCSAKVFVWVFVSSALYHVIAGLKHLVMDAGHWESLTAARVSSWAVLGLGIVSAIGMGVWIW